MTANTRSSKIDRLLRRQLEMCDQLDAMTQLLDTYKRIVLDSLARQRRLLREKETLIGLINPRHLAQANAYMAGQ